MILETDADDTQCSEQIVDVPVPQIAERIVEIGTANPRTSRCTDRQRVRTHKSDGEDRQRFKRQVANAQDATIVSRHDQAANW